MSSRVGLERFASLKETPVTFAFTTWIADSRHATDRWLPGLLLTLGYTWPKGEPNPVPMIALNTVDCSKNAFLSKGDRNGEVVVSINQSDLAPFLDSSMYLAARAVISPSGREFKGEVSSRCDDQAGTPPYGWKGTAALNAMAAHDNAYSVFRAVTAWRHESGFC